MMPTLRPYRSVIILSRIALSLCFFTAFAVGQTEGVLHNFQGHRDGALPYAGLVSDSNGNLFGTTAEGGGALACGEMNHVPIGCGTIFELSPSTGSGRHWSYNVLYAFQDGADGAAPDVSLTLDTAGNLYGVTPFGGASNLGVVFELSPPATHGGSWTETVLFNFNDAVNTPLQLTVDGLGNLYGEANGGSANGQGTIYQLTPPAVSGGAYTYTVLHVFENSDGAEPMGGLILDSIGNLYGTTQAGGLTGENCANSCGLVFELVKPPAAGGTWTDQTLYSFTGNNNDGGLPEGGVTFHAGKLYGTTQTGGSADGGTVFELSPPSGGSGAWTENIIFDFNRRSTGLGPTSSVIFDAAGNLYSDAVSSTLTSGQIFKLSPPAGSGSSWAETTLYKFTCTECMPFNLTFTRGRTLYGTTRGGGTAGLGMVFGLIP
jgi:uncharacterized repeat protein (TIGR03803 family)